MPKVDIGRQWKDGYDRSSLSPENFSAKIKGKRVKRADWYATNGTVGWVEIQFTDGSYVSIEDYVKGVGCTFVEVARE